MNHQQIKNTTVSYLTLRKWLGILGLSLPVLIWIVNGFNIEPSISHFYYTHSNVIFTGYLITFGIFLIFYPGRDDKTDKVSDNWVTTIGGLGAIFTALIPTAYDSLCKEPLVYTVKACDFCETKEISIHYIHNSPTLGTIHLCCAAIFLGLMGYMSFSRFTKGNTTKKMKRFYKLCAIMVWLSLATLGVEFIIHKEFTPYDVFIFECIALSFFGAAWLVKGKAFKKFGLS